MQVILHHADEYNSGSCEIELDTYDKIISFIREMAKVLNYSEDYMVALHITPDEFNKIPFINDEFSEIRDFNDAEYWSIFINLYCIPFFERISYVTYKNDICIDRYQYKTDEIKKGDIIYHIPNRKYFLVTKDLDKSINMPVTLFGSEEAYEMQFNSLPLYYFRKVPEYEINMLGLREKLEYMYKIYKESENLDEYYDKISDFEQQYPWL